MATVKDAPLALVGIVVGVHDTTDYQTKQVNGASVLVSSPEGGYTPVKLDLAQAAQLRPSFGEYVAWMVALSPYKLENRDAAMSVRFLRALEQSDVESMSAIFTAAAKS